MIALRGLAVRAGSARLLGPVDLTLRGGEFVALIGESGSGKTLLGRAMVGLALPGCAVEGDIWFGGGAASQRGDQAGDQAGGHGAGQCLLPAAGHRGPGAAAWRALWGRRIAHLRQDPREALDPRSAAGRQMAAVLATYGSDRGTDRAGPLGPRVRAALGRAGLSEAQGRALPGALSGGQCQRLALEMVLATPADLLVLDEPASALDGPAAQEVLSRLRARADAGAAVLMMTHDLAQAARADRIVVLHAGQVVEDRPAGAVLAGSGHPLTRALLAANPARAAVLDALRPIPPAVAIIPGLAAGPGPAGASACGYAPRCLQALPLCHAKLPLMRDGIACHRASETGAP